MQRLIGTDKEGGERFTRIKNAFIKNIHILRKRSFVISDMPIFGLIDSIYNDNVEYERKRML